MNKQKLGIIALIISLIIIASFTVPILQPENTIQCVSAPCITPDITIYEWFLQH